MPTSGSVGGGGKDVRGDWHLTPSRIRFSPLLVAVSRGSARGWGDALALACPDLLPRGFGFMFIFTLEGEALLVACSACAIFGSHPLSQPSQC